MQLKKQSIAKYFSLCLLFLTKCKNEFTANEIAINFFYFDSVLENKTYFLEMHNLFLKTYNLRDR